MPENEQSPRTDIKNEIAGMTADLREMALAHWELARLELRRSAGQIRRLAIALAAAVVMVLTALPLLVGWLARAMDGWLGIHQFGWCSMMAVGLFVGGGLTGAIAWWAFRRGFVGFAETMEECREDVVWLREWLESPQK